MKYIYILSAIVLLLVIFYGLRIYVASLHIEKSASIVEPWISLNPTNEFSVDHQLAKEPVGTIHADWQGDHLIISVVADAQSCGETVWNASYYVLSGELHVSAKGNGAMMNCPAMAMTFNFAIPNLEKRNYKIVPDITEDLSSK